MRLAKTRSDSRVAITSLTIGTLVDRFWRFDEGNPRGGKVSPPDVLPGLGPLLPPRAGRGTPREPGGARASLRRREARGGTAAPVRGGRRDLPPRSDPSLAPSLQSDPERRQDRDHRRPGRLTHPEGGFAGGAAPAGPARGPDGHSRAPRGGTPRFATHPAEAGAKSRSGHCRGRGDSPQAFHSGFGARCPFEERREDGYGWVDFPRSQGRASLGAKTSLCVKGLLAYLCYFFFFITIGSVFLVCCLKGFSYAIGWVLTVNVCGGRSKSVVLEKNDLSSSRSVSLYLCLLIAS